jgi:hypothetical protein
MDIAPVDTIPHVEVEATGEYRAETVRLIAVAIGLASDILGFTTVGNVVSIAGSAAIQSVNALLSAASAKCHLTMPPEDISVQLTSGGRIVYRCYHSPAHEWDLTGKRLP